MHWHIEHGERVPRERCAGCRNTIAAREAVLELADGNRTHLADDYACLIAWGERWRRAARQACSLQGKNLRSIPEGADRLPVIAHPIKL